MHEFFTLHYASLSLADAKTVMETICLVVSVIDNSLFAATFTKVTSIPVQTMAQVTD